MYHIAILDDEPETLRELCRLTGEVLAEQGIPHRISCFGNVDELYLAVSGGEEAVHLILLDIMIGDSAQGLELARRLREDENEVSILLVACSTEFILQGYDVQACGYLVKPVQRDQLKQKLKYDYRRRYRRQFLHTGDASWEGLPLKDVLYLETAGRRMDVHSRGGRVDTFPGRIRDVLDQLPGGMFCRCHQSFIINLDNTIKVVRYSALMQEGASVPVSKSFYKQVQEQFLHNLESR